MLPSSPRGGRQLRGINLITGGLPHRVLPLRRALACRRPYGNPSKLSGTVQEENSSPTRCWALQLGAMAVHTRTRSAHPNITRSAAHQPTSPPAHQPTSHPSPPTSEHALIHDAGARQQQHVGLQHQVVVAICGQMGPAGGSCNMPLAAQVAAGQAEGTERHAMQVLALAKACSQLLCCTHPHTPAATRHKPERTMDTTSPGSRASPASLPHLPLRYTFRGCGRAKRQQRKQVIR